MIVDRICDRHSSIDCHLVNFHILTITSIDILTIDKLSCRRDSTAYVFYSNKFQIEFIAKQTCPMRMTMTNSLIITID
jgi:hypothetical protein